MQGILFQPVAVMPTLALAHALVAWGLAICPQGGADRPKIFELITRANVGDVDAWTAHWTDPKTTAKTTATVSDGLWVEGQKVRLCGLKAEALNGQEGTWQGTVNRWRNIAWWMTFLSQDGGRRPVLLHCEVGNDGLLKVTQTNTEPV